MSDQDELEAYNAAAQEYANGQEQYYERQQAGALDAAEAQIATLTARCEALQRDYGAAQAHVAELSLEEHDIRKRCEALTAERDRLLAAQQADQERFDRDLSNFAAGYSQAVTDATQVKP